MDSGVEVYSDTLLEVEISGSTAVVTNATDEVLQLQCSLTSQWISSESPSHQFAPLAAHESRKMSIIPDKEGTDCLFIGNDRGPTYHHFDQQYSNWVLTVSNDISNEDWHVTIMERADDGRAAEIAVELNTEGAEDALDWPADPYSAMGGYTGDPYSSFGDPYSAMGGFGGMPTPQVDPRMYMMGCNPAMGAYPGFPPLGYPFGVGGGAGGVPPPYGVLQGRIKSFNADKGYGFIESGAAMALYGRDVFLHKANIRDFAVGAYVNFTVKMNKQGFPQAHDLTEVVGVKPLKRGKGRGRGNKA